MSSKEKINSVRVQIFGEELMVKGQASVDYIENMASLVDAMLSEVQESSPSLPRHRVAILVALNLASELEKLKVNYEDLLALIDEAD
ncbi:MAG: cell division protein ZapA [Bacillota bacterium]|nr:cell division protein ZapA [Bacillota bacterium]HHU62407.1 cell division protein ZapA [Natronincola sp.]